MLLSGPPSALIFFEPRIQVNPVVHAAPPELDARHPELGKERDSDAQIERRLRLAEDPCFWQPQGRVRQVMLLLHWERDQPRGGFPPRITGRGEEARAGPPGRFAVRPSRP